MRVVEKPWGKEEIWGETSKYLGKFLYINAGEMLSRQYHEIKEETIYYFLDKSSNFSSKSCPSDRRNIFSQSLRISIL